MPKNWITYFAGLLAIIYGVIGSIFGWHEPDKMMDYIIAGTGVIGFRRAMAKGQNGKI